MTFRFKSGDASVAAGLRRIAAEEFASISAALADTALSPARKVHEGRKGTKRLRALIRLAAPVFPDAQDEIAALRSSAAKLSALRDTGALAETLIRLELPVDTAATLKGFFDAQRTAGPVAHRRLLTAFALDLKAAAERAEGWTLERNGWKALEPGLAKSQHRFRKTLANAKDAATEDPVHEWRKRAKDYWYHALLLRNAFPDVMDGYASAAERLCDDLGDWRDLGLLAERISLVPAHVLPKADSAATLDLIGKARRKTLRRAFKQGRRLAAETPDAYVQRLKAWWRAPQ